MGWGYSCLIPQSDPKFIYFLIYSVYRTSVFCPLQVVLYSVQYNFFVVKQTRRLLIGGRVQNNILKQGNLIQNSDSGGINFSFSGIAEVWWTFFGGCHGGELPFCTRSGGIKLSFEGCYEGRWSSCRCSGSAKFPFRVATEEDVVLWMLHDMFFQVTWD